MWRILDGFLDIRLNESPRWPALQINNLPRSIHELLLENARDVRFVAVRGRRTRESASYISSGSTEGAGASRRPTTPTRGAGEQPAGLNVLWIEDEPILQRYVAGFLRAQGCRVDIAGDGTTGLQLATSRRHDVILIDVGLPDLSGVDVVRALRERGSTIPVIAVTGNATARDEGALRLLSCDVKRKPLVGDALLACILFACQSERALARGADGLFVPHAPGQRASIAEFLRFLSDVEDRLGGESGSAFAVADIRTECRLRLSRLLVERLSFFEYVSATGALQTTQSSLPADLVVSRIRRWFEGAPPGGDERFARTILAVVDLVEQKGAKWRLLTDDTVLKEIGPEMAGLWPEVRRAGGLTIQKCRKAVVVRRALMELAATSEQVAQIAYQTGYAHESALDRDFSRLLGMSPTQFRKILRGTAL